MISISRLLTIGLIAATSIACSSTSKDAQGGVGEADAALESSHWLSAETLLNDGKIIVEKVSYRSGAYRIYGQVCRPAAPGKHPLFIEAHGGFAGIGAEWQNASEPAQEGICRQMARKGYVAAESSYRGEDGSDGAVEVCLGEVDDVLAMVDVVRAQPYTDAKRSGILGISHGGCIALRALESGLDVQAAVEAAGPTDWAATYDSWVAMVPSTQGAERAALCQLIDQVRQAIGSTPQERPDEYRRRSPMTFLEDLERNDTSLVMLQGNADTTVPPNQTCNLAAALSGVNAHHLDGHQQNTPTAPTACSTQEIAWSGGARPGGTWPDHRYLVVYDDLGHAVGSPSALLALMGDMLGAFMAKVPAEP